MLTVEEWNALSEEEKTTRQSEKPQENQEDMILIGGKPRPLKNFVEEITRKTRESVLAEINANKPNPVRQPDANANNDWRKNIAAAAEREMEETGSIVPVNTILGLIAQGTNYQMSQINLNNKNAQKIIKEAKKELKTSCKDYADYEDRFDELLEDVEPQNVSKAGLKLIFNSLRGERQDELIAKAKEKGADDAEAGKKIIGDVESGGGGSSSGNKSTKLTVAQKEEMSDMGFEDEESYLGRLKKYQDIGKRRNAKNVPNLLSERLVF